MTETATGAETPRKRADAVRNQRIVLDAAAAVFVEDGVDAPVRKIATRAGVGMGTVYRAFPTRPELIAAVYQHQVEACAAAAPKLLATEPTPYDALRSWTSLFVDFLVTKHGLAEAINSKTEYAAFHSYFLERLVPACDTLLQQGAPAIALDGYGFLRAIGNLCIGSDTDSRYDARAAVGILLDGLEPISVRRQR
jgi:AcrR family transcriptional regulator